MKSIWYKYIFDPSTLLIKSKFKNQESFSFQPNEAKSDVEWQIHDIDNEMAIAKNIVQPKVLLSNYQKQSPGVAL